VHPLWFYKHQHDNRVCSTQNAFSLPLAAILVTCAPSGEMHNYYTPHIIKENFENFLIHRCNYILLSQVYCVWQVVKTQTFILNNPVHVSSNILLILRRSNCINTVSGIVIFCKWPSGAHSFSTCAPDGHLLRVTIPDAVLIQFELLRMSKLLLETCAWSINVSGKKREHRI